MTQNSKKTGKLEKKVKIKLGGYQAITANLLTKIEQVRNEKNTHLIELDTFSKLEQHENVSIQHRFQKLVNEVKSQEDREKELQKHYAELAHRKWELEEMANRVDATISAEPVNYNG
uniref:Flagellar FliJ protein n=1 Tax=Acrobeloides nanus TaxID=290746 RepID=A0A914EMJ3_9BILA